MSSGLFGEILESGEACTCFRDIFLLALDVCVTYPLLEALGSMYNRDGLLARR